MNLSDRWREQMVAMICGATPAKGTWFRGSSRLSPDEQIAIYVEQYQLRMWDALADDIPGLKYLLGEQAEDILWAYLKDYPPNSWTLARIADRLPEWLEEQGHPSAWIDMARLDSLVQSGFVAGELLIPRPEQIGTVSLVRQPHIGLLRARANVHEIRSAVVSDTEPPPLIAGDYPLVLFRIERAMRHLIMEAPAFALLAHLDEGLDIALDAAVSESGDIDTVLPKISTWFRWFAERGMLGIRS